MNYAAVFTFSQIPEIWSCGQAELDQRHWFTASATSSYVGVESLKSIDSSDGIQPGMTLKTCTWIVINRIATVPTVLWLTDCSFRNTTFMTISAWPWAAAKCRAVSSPIFVAFIRTPRFKSISTMLVFPSMAAQCNRLKRWSSLTQKKLKLSRINMVVNIKVSYVS